MYEDMEFWVHLLWFNWHLTPVLLPGKSHGRRSLIGCTPWGREESDTTERLHFTSQKLMFVFFCQDIGTAIVSDTTDDLWFLNESVSEQFGVGKKVEAADPEQTSEEVGKLIDKKVRCGRVSH